LLQGKVHYIHPPQELLFLLADLFLNGIIPCKIAKTQYSVFIFLIHKYKLIIMDIVHRLAKNVHFERLKQGLSQADLAEKADLHPNYIGLIERSQCNISILTLEKLAKALEVEICNLI